MLQQANRRRRGATAVTCAIVLATVVTVWQSPPASATNDCYGYLGRKCYGITVTNSSSFGARTKLYMTSQSIPDPTQENLVQALWAGTPGCNCWVEVGYFTGAAYNVGYSVNERFYWADLRPNGSYFVHIVTGIGNPWDYWNTWLPVAMFSSTSGGTSYLVSIGSTFVGTSAPHNCCSTSYLNSGTESSDTGGVTHSGTGILGALTIYGWADGWSGSTTHGDLNVCYGTWWIAGYSAFTGCN